jgi:hypothetical protein
MFSMFSILVGKPAAGYGPSGALFALAVVFGAMLAILAKPILAQESATLEKLRLAAAQGDAVAQNNLGFSTTKARASR